MTQLGNSRPGNSETQLLSSFPWLSTLPPPPYTTGAQSARVCRPAGVYHVHQRQPLPHRGTHTHTHIHPDSIALSFGRFPLIMWLGILTETSPFSHFLPPHTTGVQSARVCRPAGLHHLHERHLLRHLQPPPHHRGRQYEGV